MVAAILGIAVIVALGARGGLLDEPAAVKSPAGVGTPVRDIAAPLTPLRANYNYSVIPGGAFDGQELKRAYNRDAVVAHHYSGVDPSTMRPEILTADRLAYVSYRKGDRVYWTSRQVRIRSGETILTNGQTEIRARCGNCISRKAMLPTSADEPGPMQLDALVDTGNAMLDALNDTALPAVSWPMSPFGPVAAVESWGVVTTPVDVQLFAANQPSTPLGAPKPPINTAPVPEPGTFLLLGGGVACLIAWRWRSIRT